MLTKQIFKEKKYYNCFSSEQFQFLVSCGLEPVALNYHNETNARFYVFMNTNELSLALRLYTQRKKVKNS